MKSTLILVSAAVVAAQTGYFPGEPSCAIPCLTSAISAVGCDLSDVSCQCGPSQTAIGASAATCLLGSCNLTEVAQAQSAGLAVCSSLSAGLLTITSAPTATGTATSTDTISHSGDTLISAGTGTTASATGTKTLTKDESTTTAGTGITVATTSTTSASSTAKTNAAVAVAGMPAQIFGGIIAGILGLAVL
ncbi:hypothetical protein BX600DRAFT_513146 [Xylariales sp. PMI_506]|nr:hypothetical protein BX600DRAFT_513146 [Xylariales sp. PMI_506]